MVGLPEVWRSVDNEDVYSEIDRSTTDHGYELLTTQSHSLWILARTRFDWLGPALEYLHKREWETSPLKPTTRSCECPIIHFEWGDVRRC